MTKILVVGYTRVARIDPAIPRAVAFNEGVPGDRLQSGYDVKRWRWKTSCLFAKTSC